MLHLIDRRPNGRGKSAVNRERFLRRYKAQIQEAVKKMVGERHLADMERGGEVRVPRKDVSEPAFGFGRGGDREFVLPGTAAQVLVFGEWVDATVAAEPLFDPKGERIRA